MKIRHIYTLIVASIVLTSCNQGGKSEKDIPKLSVGIQVSPAMALVMVAEDEGFFDKEGVDVEIKEFTAGKFALQAFLGGSLDVAVSGEVPVSLSALQGNKFRVIGQVVKQTNNEVRVVALREDDVNDAKGYFDKTRRKLATSFGGGPEFFTYEFLKLHAIDEKSVDLISQKPEDMAPALLSKSVDAIAIFDPFAHIAEKNLKDKGVTFADPGIYSELYVIDVLDETITEKRPQLLAFLRGLKSAEGFIVENPDRSKEIVSKYTKLEADIIDGIWKSFDFGVAINDLYLQYTYAQAKWAIEKGKFPSDTPIPNYRAILDTTLLKEVAPSAVQLSASMLNGGVNENSKTPQKTGTEQPSVNYSQPRE